MPAISVVGLGKLGLCLAACLAYKGQRVIGVDIDVQKIQSINNGQAPFYEPRLQDLLKQSRERLTAVSSYDQAIRETNTTFIVVNTPSEPEGGYSLKYVNRVAESLGRALREKRDYHLVVLTSTVLPGSTEQSIRPILEDYSGKNCGEGFGLCYSPEFLALGNAVEGILRPDLVLIGEHDKKSGDILEAVYKQLCENSPPVRRMTIINAEITKIALNAYITMKISFANTLAGLCEKVAGGNVDEVTSALGLDSRIGSRSLRGGLGYGGPCFPRDSRAFGYYARRNGCQGYLADASDEVNRHRISEVVEFIKKQVSRDAKRVAVLGMTYKPNTAIVEESQSMRIAEAMAGAGYRVKVYDPEGLEEAKKYLGSAVSYAKSVNDCIDDADILIVATAWEQFGNLEANRLRRGSRLIVDCWRTLDSRKFSGDKRLVQLGVSTEKERAR